MLTPLRSRMFGDSLSWTTVAMFDSQSHDREELLDAFPSHDGGPGRGYSDPPMVVEHGRYTFVWQSGGLDV